jgi:hypothetical protein
MAGVLVQRVGYAIIVSDLVGRPLPQDLYKLVTPSMEYIHVEHLRGFERHKLGKEDDPFLRTRRALYSFDSYGRLTCGAGFTERLIRKFADLGLETEHRLIGKWANPPRPAILEPDWVAVDSEFEFRERQRECLQRIDEVVSCYLGGVVDAAAGFGKTELFAAICKLYPRARIAVMVPGSDLVDAVYARLIRSIPSVGLVGRKTSYGPRVTVYSADSIHKVRHPDEIDLLLVDEAHAVITSARLAKLNSHVMGAIRIGFSATTGGREDKMDARLEPTFGRTIFHLSPSEAVARELSLPVEVHWNHVGGFPNPAAGIEEDTERARLGIWQNEPRNRVIAERARTYGPDVQSLILVRSAEHAAFLQALLPDHRMVYGQSDATADTIRTWIRRGLIPPECDPDQIEEPALTRKRFESGELKKVIATMVWKQGISAEQLRVVIWGAAGRSKIDGTQGPSRANRISQDKTKKVAILEDFTDEFDPQFARHASARRSIYRSLGWTNIGSGRGSRRQPQQQELFDV